jgi:hypothetical protein
LPQPPKLPHQEQISGVVGELPGVRHQPLALQLQPAAAKPDTMAFGDRVHARAHLINL